MRRRPGLVTRLLAAQLLVIVVGAGTLAAVAMTTGPTLFRDHLQRVLGVLSPDLSTHVQEAFAASTGIAVGVGVAASVLAGTLVSLLVARKLSHPIRALDQAAARLAAGDHTARMPPTRLGPEFDVLTDAFNTMATSLENTEEKRRRLLADVAHELRTPLATIDGYLEGLADGVRAPTQDTWDILAAQTARLRRLMDDITLVSRAEENQLDLHPRPTPPNDLVTAALAAAQPSYRKSGVTLASRLGSDLPAVRVDPERIGQVLANLLSNALRHTPRGGRVTVTTEAVGPEVRITVADTGDGIAPEHLPRLFERFYRADTARDRARGGSGIGLTIARALVTAHGGTLTVASAGPGTGAQFVITLPAD